MDRKQHYMNRDERVKLEALREAGISVAQIARQLGFSRQTIYNEIKRGLYHRVALRGGYYRDEWHYSADKGQQKHRYNQTAKGRPLKLGADRAYAQFLEDKIVLDRYSPGAALAQAQRVGFTTCVCVSTLYSYIDKGVFLRLTNDHLWDKSKRQRRGYRPVSRIVHPKLPSITDRPDYINDRLEYGHWEMDLVVSKAGSRGALLTLTERLSRQELMFKLPDKQAATVRKVFNRLERNTPRFREKFKSITTDNGPEFLEYDKLCRSIYGGRRFDIYYCHTYAAWEKGSNENHNRMIRRFFPKGTDFTNVTQKEVAAIQDWMNGYPRKILGWQAPMDISA